MSPTWGKHRDRWPSPMSNLEPDFLRLSSKWLFFTIVIRIFTLHTSNPAILNRYLLLLFNRHADPVNNHIIKKKKNRSFSQLSLPAWNIFVSRIRRIGRHHYRRPVNRTPSSWPIPKAIECTAIADGWFPKEHKPAFPSLIAYWAAIERLDFTTR